MSQTVRIKNWKPVDIWKYRRERACARDATALRLWGDRAFPPKGGELPWFCFKLR